MPSQLTAKLVDSMGTDLTVVNAARVSFNKESKFEKSIEKKSFFNENEFISEIINNNEILYYSTEWSKSVVNLSEENLFSESYETSGTLTENNVISYLDI